MGLLISIIIVICVALIVLIVRSCRSKKTPSEEKPGSVTPAAEPVRRMDITLEPFGLDDDGRQSVSGEAQVLCQPIQ